MYAVTETALTRAELESLLSAIDNARIALIGDLCLDMYWLADMTLSELSRETPHYPLPIIEERWAPGGAGNAVCNIAALQPQKLLALGVVGTDWRGDLLLSSLRKNGVDCTHIVRDADRVTNAYLKPLRRGISNVVYEDPRLDFEARSPLSPATEKRLLDALDAVASQVDVICVSDQMKFGCITPAVRARLCALAQSGKTVIVDSRDHAADYAGVTLKPNEVEASRAFADGSALSLDALSELAQTIARRHQRPALLTLGENGCFVADGETVIRCPACKVEPPIDFCGAGDTFMAGYAALIAGGASPVQAAQAANLCSAVTIRKIGTTGTASRQEVLDAWERYTNR